MMSGGENGVFMLINKHGHLARAANQDSCDDGEGHALRCDSVPVNCLSGVARITHPDSLP